MVLDDQSNLQSDSKKRKWSNSINHIASILPKLLMITSITDDYDRKRRRSCSESTDTISQLPKPILQHILSFLSQNEATQTCVLSKSWRYLGPTRPNIDLHRLDFSHHDEAAFISVVDRSLRVYDDQKMCVREFTLVMLAVDDGSISLLEKWIPSVVLGSVKTFSLTFESSDSPYFDLPSAAFKIKSLENLRLRGCRLSRHHIDYNVIMWKNLVTLSFTSVYVSDDVFRTIMSSCVIVQNVALYRCPGLTAVKVDSNNTNGHKCYNLKRFDFSDYDANRDLPFRIDVPSLEIIKIFGNWNIRYDHNVYLPRLKTLHIFMVRLSSSSFDILSSNLPNLQDLTIDYCRGFKKLRLLNRSIKNLSISRLEESVDEVTIDAPNIASFGFKGHIPSSISFTATSSEWKSSISECYNGRFDDYNASSSWFVKLNKLLEAVSQSEISLTLSRFGGPGPLIAEDNDGGLFIKPVLVENLKLDFTSQPAAYFPALLMRIFGCCRPRNIHQDWFSDPRGEREWNIRRLTEFLRETLVTERGGGEEGRQIYFWQQDLEEARMEMFDAIGKRWHSVESSAELLRFRYKRQVWFKLKWREEIMGMISNF